MSSIEITEKISFSGWDNCIRMRNDQVELIVTTDIGPRIIYFGFREGENLLYVNQEHAGKQGGNEWRIYGGHRLWLSPEIYPITFTPDNDPVFYRTDGEKLILTQQEDALTGVIKEIEISLRHDSNEVSLVHRLIKNSKNEIEVAPWAITAFAQNGHVIIPQEPYIDENDYYLPARPIVLWHYTKMNDHRLNWGNKFIIARQDPTCASPQKFGVLNKKGWSAYLLHDQLLVKKFEYIKEKIYPDFGCNNEVYLNDKLIEVESLGPLSILQTGTCVTHKEIWVLSKVNFSNPSEDVLSGYFS